MSKFAMKMPEAQEVRLYRGEIRVLSRQNDFLYNVELSLLDDTETRNGWRYENLEKHRPLFAGKPILIAYTRGGQKIGDGHNMRTVRGADGKEYASFTDADSERIIGSLSDDEQDIRLEDRDGHKWIVGRGSIWTWYAREAVEKIASQGRMDISIETLVTKNRMEGDEEVEEEYIILGATILGDDVPPAVIGANIRPLSIRDEAAFRDLKLRAASYAGKEDEPEQKTPAERKNKGVRHKVSKKLIEKVQGLFPDYRVLSVSEDGNAVMLRRLSDGELKGYVFPDTDRETIREGCFEDVTVSVVMNSADGLELRTDADSLTGELEHDLADAKAALEHEKSLREQAEKDLQAVREQQRKQRRLDAKAAMKRELAEINEALAAEEQVDEKELADVEKDIDEGEYDDCTNADGAWAGCEKVCAAVQAKCMQMIKEIRSKRTRVNAWDAVKGFGSGDDATLKSYNNLK